ncbi:thermonuclease family protein [Saccharopolyspora shandongensis]|uniref:thermonuclease family protein n=1 Tax=Saccharopolyspora shandongensis TaxID=418495 RepID=UPI0033EA31CF
MARRYTLITGDFYIRYPDLPRNGPEPDGDTINFLPDNDDLVRSLPRFSNHGPDRRHLGTYGTRFEGIDTLETHFENQHQNLPFADAARDHMLDKMGFGAVEFWDDLPNKVESAEHHPVRGYLLANGVESNGRLLGLVYPGEPDLAAADGDPVFVDVERLERSVNVSLVRAGLAYAELYATMPLALIEHLRGVVKEARADGAGMWPQEAVTTERRVQLTTLADLSELVMFPKLYRRLVKYFKEGHGDLAAFDMWVRADPVDRDDTALLPTGELGNLHDLYNVTADGIKLQFLPEELMFAPDPVPPL